MRIYGAFRSWPEAEAGVSGRLPEVAVSWLAEVYRFAAEWHAGQTRPAGEPYYRHLLEVLEILVTHANITDQDLLAAALLHDVVEDTACTLGAVDDQFGHRTASLVEWVTMPPVSPTEDRSQARHRYLVRLSDAPPDVRRLKLADRYSNVQRLHTHPRVPRQREYFQETCRYFIPVAADDPVFAELFATWHQAYRYLAAS